MYIDPIVCKLYMRWDSFNWFATVLLLFIILTVEIEKYKKFHFENQGLKNQYLIVYHFFIKIFFCKEKIIFSLLQDWKLIENLNLKAYKKRLSIMISCYLNYFIFRRINSLTADVGQQNVSFLNINCGGVRGTHIDSIPSPSQPPPHRSLLPTK